MAFFFYFRFMFTRILVLPILLLCSVDAFNQSIDDLLDEAWSKYDSSPQECVEILNQAIQKSRDDNQKQKELEALEMKGIVYDELGYGNKAMDIYMDVLKARETEGNQYAMISLNLNLGILHARIENIDQSKYHYQEALRLARELNDLEGELNAINNLGGIASKNGNFDESIAYFNSILAMEGLEDDYYFTSHTNLGTAYRRANNPKQALHHFTEAEQFMSEEKGFLRLSYLINLGIALRMDEQYSRSEKTLLEAYDLASSIQNRSFKSNTTVELAVLYKELKQDSTAYYWLNEHLMLKDSLNVAQNNKYFTTLNTVYEVDKKEQDIAKLKQEKEARNRRIWTISATSIVIILLLLALATILRTKLKQRKQQQEIQALQLEKQQADLEKYKGELNLKTENLLERNRMLQKIEEELNAMKSSETNPEMLELLKSKILTNQDWDNYKRSFNLVHPGFFEALTAKAPDLTQGEQRTSALMRLGLSNLEISEILGISERSVIQNKYRLRKKVGLEDNEQLMELLEQLG